MRLGAYRTQRLSEANPKGMGLRKMGLALKSLAKREKDLSQSYYLI